MSSVRGWCPTAYRPMAAADGLLVRVRPRLARLTRAQALGLSAAAIAHGNGEIDCTNRANLQIRGVSESGWPALIAALLALDLVDPDPVLERRHAVLVAPDWRAGDDTHRIASALLARLAAMPDLPGKFGFAIDAGATPVLRADPADFRIERGESGRLLLRADGHRRGAVLPVGRESDALVALAQWFVASGGSAAGRMARHTAALPHWAMGTEAPAAARDGGGAVPGAHPLGAIVGVPFGRIAASALAALVAPAAVVAIRMTPWRRLLIEGGTPGTTHDPATLDADACVGAPACPQATVETRALAERLAPFVAGHLHVSGCAKGCAHARPSEVVLTGRDGRFDLAFAACAGDRPAMTGLDPRQILSRFGAA